MEKSVLSTLAFFAAQNQAVTLLELRSWLVKVSPDQVPAGVGQLRELLRGGLGARVDEKNGLYFLRGHEESAGSRLDRHVYTMRLFKKTKRWATGLRFLPYVRAAALSGSAAQSNARPLSDIDLLIITERNKIFLARFFVSAYFQILGGRRYGKKIVERFCLNHYVVRDLELEDDRNLYTAMEYASLVPIFGEAEVGKFWEANKGWVNSHLLHPALPSSPVFLGSAVGPSAIQRAMEAILFPVSGLLEALAGFFQRRRIRQSQYVVVCDTELSFHPESKGQRILARWRGLMEGLAD